jgi:hypothetical protein
VAAALVLGTGTALANMTSLTVSSTTPTTSTGSTGTTVAADADAHGDAVANAAKTCPKGTGDAHGDCVSKVASAEGQENRDGARAAAVAACKAADVKEDNAEKKSSAGLTKTQKKADRAEDKAEHKKFVACVTGTTKP